MSLAEKRLFLLDMDGTIYLSETLFDGTLEFLRYVRAIDGRYLFLTNNSSRGTDAYIAKMARLGIEASRQTTVNLPSRIRMATLYAIAQSEEGGIVKRETPIRSCKVALFCEKCNKGVRVGYKMDGDKKVRICRKCGAEI
mgnify:CR=1 FL=1